MWVLGQDVNLVWAVLVFFTVWMVVYNLALGWAAHRLPTALVELFYYGKTLNGPARSRLVSLISVPKQWFTHFYVFSSVYTPLLLGLSLHRWVGGADLTAGWAGSGLDLVCGQERPANTTASRASLALALLCLQSLRRLYECAVVNQASNATMNLTHYIVGFAHYWAAGTGILCETPGPGPGPLQWPGPGPALLALVTLAAQAAQLDTHRRLARLKASSGGGHALPQGGLFTWVSCPHYTAEVGWLDCALLYMAGQVVIYFCLAGVLGPAHRTGLLLAGWVLTNQTIAASMSHSWYRTKFPEYPPSRKAIIPYIW